MRDVVIIEAGRSPIGKRNGALSGAHPTELLGQVMMEVLKRAGVPSASVGQVVGGCINKVGAQAMSVTRTAWLTGGGPVEVRGVVVPIHIRGLASQRLSRPLAGQVGPVGCPRIARQPLAGDHVVV